MPDEVSIEEMVRKDRDRLYNNARVLASTVSCMNRAERTLWATQFVSFCVQQDGTLSKSLIVNAVTAFIDGKDANEIKEIILHLLRK